MAADFEDEVASSYKGKQRVNRKGTPLLPPEEVSSNILHIYTLGSRCCTKS